MTLELYYEITSVISACVFILANVYVIKSGRNQPKDVKHSNLLIITGIICIIVTIVSVSMPELRIYNFSMLELETYQNYNLIKGLFLEISFLITFGGFLLVMGMTNRKKFDVYLINSAILMCITYITHIFCIFSYFTALIIQEVFSSPLWYYYLVTMNIGITTYSLALAFLIIHGKRNDDKYIIYAVMLMIIRNFGESLLQWIFGFLFGFI